MVAGVNVVVGVVVISVVTGCGVGTTTTGTVLDATVSVLGCEGTIVFMCLSADHPPSIILGCRDIDLHSSGRPL